MLSNHSLATRIPTVMVPMLLAIGFWMTAGCSQKAEISSYEAPADKPADAAVDGAAAPAATMASPTATALEDVEFNAPEDWTAGKAGGMRKAAFTVQDGDKKAEITVIDLAAAAGVLLPNVNIWRQQVQLGEADALSLDDSVSPIEVDGTKGQYIELMGPEDAENRQAVLAVMLVRGPKSWFFKLKGDAELAQSQKETFLTFVKSAKFKAAASGGSGMAGMPGAMPPHGAGGAMSPHGAGGAMSPHGAGGAMPPHGAGGMMPSHGSGMSMPGGMGAPAASPLTYETPEGWKAGPAAGMRKAAFQVSDGGKRAEVTAIDLSASAGDLLPNINRWRGQIGLEPINDEQLKEAISPIQVDGSEGQFVELVAPGDAEKQQAILGVITVHQNKSWFFKMIGDTELAQKQKDNFRTFVESIRFEAPKQPAPATEAPATEAPTTEAPTTEAPTTEAPATEAPATEAPATEAPATEAPATEAPATEAPATEAPATEAPATEAPATEAPATEAPATEAPATEAPATEAPATEAPATEAPATEAPATEAPATEAPATEAPATEAPATEAPTPETSTPDTSPPETPAAEEGDPQ